MARTRHNKSPNVTFADGHAKSANNYAMSRVRWVPTEASEQHHTQPRKDESHARLLTFPAVDKPHERQGDPDQQKIPKPRPDEFLSRPLRVELKRQFTLAAEKAAVEAEKFLATVRAS